MVILGLINAGLDRVASHFAQTRNFSEFAGKTSLTSRAVKLKVSQGHASREALMAFITKSIFRLRYRVHTLTAQVAHKTPIRHLHEIIDDKGLKRHRLYSKTSLRATHPHTQQSARDTTTSSNRVGIDKIKSEARQDCPASSSAVKSSNIIGPENVPIVQAPLGLTAQAAVATLLQFHRASIAPGELGDFLGGTQADVQGRIVECVRQLGFVAYHGNRGPAALYEQLLAAEPVMVLLGRGLPWWPVWRYAVVNGMNVEEEQLYLHTGQDYVQCMPMSEFMNQWRRSRFWSLSLERPELIPSFAELEPVLETAHFFEEGGQLDDAWTLYTAACERWPNQPAPLEGLGDIRYQEGHFQQAATWYQRALELARSSANLPVRLAWALARAGRRRQAVAILDSSSVKVEKSARHKLAVCRQAIGRLPRDEVAAP